LRQRAVTSVLYLNTLDEGFTGGCLLFNNPCQRVEPAKGRMACFLATEEHAVEAVGSGERLTLVVWFSRDPAALEDVQVCERAHSLCGYISISHSTPPASAANSWMEMS
jgi:Rps23 Pro-64 3,4-dihydroxylase Tpa1-like proline 4-hydroxylase